MCSKSNHGLQKTWQVRIPNLLLVLDPVDFLKGLISVSVVLPKSSVKHVPVVFKNATLLQKKKK